jgi:hypothetical protein
VPVEVIGRLGDITWFQAVDHVRVQRPRIAVAGSGLGGPDGPMPSLVQSESYVPLHFIDPVDGLATAFELWYSPDAGENWSAIDTNLTVRDYAWSVPEEATEQAMLGLVARDALGVMGMQVSNVFQIIHGTTDVGRPAPSRFSLRFAGHNPASRARLEFGMPARGEVSVRVYDVKGALVRELARGPFEPGWHGVTWDGAGATGSAVEPGMYFVQAHANGQRLLKRFALIR